MAVGEKHDAHQQCQQKDMHHIQHPGSAQDLHAGNQVTVAQGDLAVGQHCRVPGQKHEDLRCIAETEIAHGEMSQRILRHVIPENEDQRQTAKEIDARVASVKHDSGLLSECLIEWPAQQGCASKIGGAKGGGIFR
jgi:hypothetical protein